MILQYSVWIFLNRFFSSFVFFRPPKGGFSFIAFYDSTHMCVDPENVFLLHAFSFHIYQNGFLFREAIYYMVNIYPPRINTVCIGEKFVRYYK